MGKKTFVGYSRVSTQEQSLDPQNDELRKAGCGEIFSDIASGAKTARPELERALQYLRPDDVLVVYKLNHLGRSLKHLIEIVGQLKPKNGGTTPLRITN